jgi:predicted dehydrogenase
VFEENELSIKDTNAIEEELKSFADSILNNKKVVVSLDDGIRAMELAAKIEAEMNHQN